MIEKKAAVLPTVKYRLNVSVVLSPFLPHQYRFSKFDTFVTRAVVLKPRPGDTVSFEQLSTRSFGQQSRHPFKRRGNFSSFFLPEWNGDNEKTALGPRGGGPTYRILRCNASEQPGVCETTSTLDFISTTTGRWPADLTCGSLERPSEGWISPTRNHPLRHGNPRRFRCRLR